MTIASAPQFHAYLPWGQYPSSIVSLYNGASRVFQPGEGPSRGLLCDCLNRWIVCSSSFKLGPIFRSGEGKSLVTSHTLGFRFTEEVRPALIFCFLAENSPEDTPRVRPGDRHRAGRRRPLIKMLPLLLGS